MNPIFEELKSIAERIAKEGETEGKIFTTPRNARHAILDARHELNEVIFDLKSATDWWKFQDAMRTGSFSSLSKDIKQIALRCACEIIQLAAMADKAMRGFACEDEK